MILILARHAPALHLADRHAFTSLLRSTSNYSAGAVSVGAAAASVTLALFRNCAMSSAACSRSSARGGYCFFRRLLLLPGCTRQPSGIWYCARGMTDTCMRVW